MAEEGSGCEVRNEQTTLFRFLHWYGFWLRGSLESPPATFELFGSVDHVPPVVGRDTCLVHLLNVMIAVIVRVDSVPGRRTGPV
jgi:hypothetical protein